MCISSILQDVYMITMHSVDYYSNIPHCGSLFSIVVEVYKEMSVATVALKHHKSYFTAKKESYLAAQGYWSMYNSSFIL